MKEQKKTSLWRRLFPQKIVVNQISISKQERGNMKIIVVEPESDSLAVSIGIDEKRAKEIISLVTDGFTSTKKKSDAMLKISADLYHPNELFFATWVLRDVSDQLDGNPLVGLLKHLKKLREE